MTETQNIDRLPALPLITNDPYFSYWLPGDEPMHEDVVHWSGAEKRLNYYATVDGRRYRLLGKGGGTAAKTLSVRVTATQTAFEAEAGGVRFTYSFRTPLLPDDLDILSTPITFVDCSLQSADGAEHEVEAEFSASAGLTYDGQESPDIWADTVRRGTLNLSYAGQVHQKLLCHSGDHITIDWGYLYLASACRTWGNDRGLGCSFAKKISASAESFFLLLGYDDVASVNYFGTPCRAWFQRNGKTLPDALVEFAGRYEELKERCVRLDARIASDAAKAGGEDYVAVVNAAYRQCIAAHKLIATPAKEPALLSKENDSNGCIGTVDVSYPSVPLFLKYCPELVNALLRPVLEFASLPVWKYDFAPHDVGRYPHATGQVYALKKRLKNGDVYPPYYLYTASDDIYDDYKQMPVEESGDMLIMAWSAIYFGADDSLARAYLPLFEKWVRYLETYGANPGEQLCTDDFAGHLAGNANLSAKAIVGIRCYAELLRRFGRESEAEQWSGAAKGMAEDFRAWADSFPESPLTLEGAGWSMKYNLVWDRVLHFSLLPGAFYERECGNYVKHFLPYGLPLDSRDVYTKSDWILWCSAMTDDRALREAFIRPVRRYLQETKDRVPFSDWYNAENGRSVRFIGRSVQGGLFMPMLR